MQEHSLGGLYSSFIKSKSCVSLRNCYEDYNISRSRLLNYYTRRPYTTYLYQLRDFNLSGSKSETSTPHSITSVDDVTNDTEMCIEEKRLCKEYNPQSYQEVIEQVLVINQLNSNIDVTSVIDEVLFNQEFSNVSSLCVVVPTSDDEETPVSLSKLSSTKCMQLTEYKSPWNKTEDLYWPQRRTSKMNNDLGISLKGRQYFLEGLSTTVYKTNNIDNNITKDCHNKLAPKPMELKKNKLCQITTTSEKVRADIRQLQIQNNANAKSTDTTVDRPCCCMANNQANNCMKTTEKEYSNCCANSVVSQMLIKSNFVPQGLTYNSVAYSKQANNQKKQILNMPGNQIPISISMCQMDQHNISDGYPAPQDNFQHPGRSYQEKFNISMDQSCKCSTAKILQLFEKLQADKLRNMKSIACGERLEINSSYAGFTGPFLPTPSNKFHLKSNENGCMKCNKKKTVTINPINHYKEYQMSMPKPIGPKYGRYSVGIQSTFKDNFVVIGPDGREIPVLGQTVPCLPGTIPGLVSTAVQNGLGCLNCSTKSPSVKRKSNFFKSKIQSSPVEYSSTLEGEIGLIEVLGPIGGYASVEPGGTYTQAGHKEIRISSAAGPGGAFEQVDTVNMAVTNNNKTINNVLNAEIVVSDGEGKKNKKKDLSKTQGNVVNKSKPSKKSKLKDKVEKFKQSVANKKSNSKDKVDVVDTVNASNKKSNIQFASSNTAMSAKKGKIDHLCECSLFSQDGDENSPDYISTNSSDTAWMDPRLLAHLRSELTLTTSGFIVHKNPKPLDTEVEIEVSLEDAVKYYASQHPEVLADLFSTYQGLSNIKPCKCESKISNETPSDGSCFVDNVKINLPQPTTEPSPSVIKLEGNEVDQPQNIFTGLRLKKSGKGTASQGLHNVIVFK